MALTDENGTGMVMPVAPMYGGYGNGGFGGFGGDGWWIILLLLAFNGGWGGMGGCMWPMMMGAGGGFGLGYDFPWLLNGQNQINANTNAGFDHAATQTALGNLQNAVTGGFSDVQLSVAGLGRQICETGNQLGNTVQNGFAQAEIANGGRHNSLVQQLYSNEIASLQRSFAEQTANQAGFNGVQAGLADAKYTEATEACATRTAAAQNTRDIIDAQTRGTQAILDKLCALELDNVKSQLAQAQRENVGLQNQVNMANMQASQVAQTAQILAGQTAEVDALYNRLNSCPVPTTPVYGRTPIFTCNNGCGCSGNAGFVN